MRHCPKMRRRALLTRLKTRMLMWHWIQARAKCWCRPMISTGRAFCWPRRVCRRPCRMAINSLKICRWAPAGRLKICVSNILRKLSWHARSARSTPLSRPVCIWRSPKNRFLSGTIRNRPPLSWCRWQMAAYWAASRSMPLCISYRHPCRACPSKMSPLLIRTEACCRKATPMWQGV